MTAISERHVQAIWYDASLRPAHLVTRRGTEVVVVSPGEWNLGPGPDFRHAVLELGPERRRVSGDVEIHLAPSDWDLHGHGTDPNYRNVIAHVTWGCGPEPSTLPPDAVSIWIGRFMTANTAFSPDQIDLAAYPYAARPPSVNLCGETLGRDPDRAREVLVAAGRRRLRLKAERMVGRLGDACARRRGDSEDTCARQTFYEEVMTALGYTKNEHPFRRVAERLPIDSLPKDPEIVRSAFLVAGSFESWHRGGNRPLNTPERRLANAADLFTATPTMELARADDFSKAGCREMVSAMCCGNAVGRGRAGAVIANVVVPFALAEGRLREVPEWLPPEDVSGPVRLTAYRLFGRDHNPAACYSRNGLLIQGLLHIHHELCRSHHPDCADCALAAGYPKLRAPSAADLV